MNTSFQEMVSICDEIPSYSREGRAKEEKHLQLVRELTDKSLYGFWNKLCFKKKLKITFFTKKR